MQHTYRKPKTYYKSVNDILDRDLYQGFKGIMDTNASISIMDAAKILCKRLDLNPDNVMPVYAKYKGLQSKFNGVDLTTYNDTSLDNNFLNLVTTYYKMGADARLATSIVRQMTNLKAPYVAAVDRHLDGMTRSTRLDFERSQEVHEYLRLLKENIGLSRSEVVTLASKNFSKSITSVYRNLDNEELRSGVSATIVKKPVTVEIPKKIAVKKPVKKPIKKESPMLWEAWKPEPEKPMSDEVLAMVELAVDHINLGSTVYNAYTLAKKVTGISGVSKQAIEDYLMANVQEKVNFFTSELVYEHYLELLRSGVVSGSAVLKISAFYRKNVLAVHKVLKHFKKGDTEAKPIGLSVVKSEPTECKVEKLSNKDRGFMISEISYMLRQQSDLYLQSAYYKLAGINEKQSA